MKFQLKRYLRIISWKKPNFYTKVNHLSTTNNCIYILKSGNIFRNLAFEACLYNQGERELRNIDKPPHYSNILLWRSDPCVVIGRFQNPWQEVNLNLLKSRRWPIARRHSGGGAVFHDKGNLNISFMQPRFYLNRKVCMEFLQSVLQPLQTNQIVHVGERHDLWISEEKYDNGLSKLHKISGSSSKLGSGMAYHHCTLLLNVNLDDLSGLLTPTFPNIETRATGSVRSPVVNLNMNVDFIQNIIVNKFVEYFSSASYQNKNNSNVQTNIITVEENEENKFVNSNEFQNELKNLQSWSWIYGNSPKFQIRIKNFQTELLNLDSLLLLIERGAYVDQIKLEPKLNNHNSQLISFLQSLNSILHGTECRRYHWNTILDNFVTNYLFNSNLGNLTFEQDLIILILKNLCDHF